MAKKKVAEEFFEGNVTWEMFCLWVLASLPESYEVRLQIATLQFYFKTSTKDGLRVIGTKALAVTEQIASAYYNK